MYEKPSLTTHPLNDPVLSVRLRAISQIIGQPLATPNRAALIEAADTIERIQSERTFWHEKWRRDWRALNEARAEVERLKGEKSEILVKLQMARADLEAEARSLGYTG